MKYLLDTCTVSFALGGIGGVSDRLRRLRPVDVAISSVTEAELWYGVRKRGSKKLERLVASFLQPIQVLPFDSEAARRYAVVQHRLDKAGTPIGMADVMIASVGLARGLVLVTGNTRHFRRIRGLRVEDWR